MELREGVRDLELLGIVLGVIALLLAIWHLYEIRAQAKEIRAQAKDIRSQAKLSKTHANMLDSILRSMSTRHIGQFPEYIITIANLIENAKKEIVILCDFPAYGSFSAPHDFLRYKHAIERKIDQGVKVRLTCLSSVSRTELAHEQFSREEKMWDEWKQQPKKHELFRSLLKSHGSDISVDALSVDQFAAFLEQEDVRMLKETFTQADVLQIGAYIPLYFWLIDGGDAVFAIPSFSEKSTEHGFYTLDPHLIAGFLDIEARYHR